VVVFPSVVVVKVKKEETILSVYPQQKLELCRQVKDELLYQENKVLKEELVEVKDLTTQGLN
jgi:hypothetical protein